MDVKINEKTYKLKDIFTGADLLDIEEPEGSLILDEKGTPKPYAKWTPIEKKLAIRAQKLQQYCILSQMLIEPKLTPDQLIKLDARIINKLLVAIKPIVGE